MPTCQELTLSAKLAFLVHHACAKKGEKVALREKRDFLPVVVDNTSVNLKARMADDAHGPEAAGEKKEFFDEVTGEAISKK